MAWCHITVHQNVIKGNQLKHSPWNPGSYALLARMAALGLAANFPQCWMLQWMIPSIIKLNQGVSWKLNMNLRSWNFVFWTSWVWFSSWPWFWPWARNPVGPRPENDVTPEFKSVLLKHGRQMRPMNPPGDPRSYHRWSVWRPMDSLGFAENAMNESGETIPQMHWYQTSIVP